MKLAFSGEQLDIEIANAGGRADRAVRPGVLRGAESGHGLVGMRERAALLGGTLEAGPDDDGFRVHTSLRIDG